MNKVILMGRLTKDPEVRQSQGAEPVTIARYTLAVNRRGRKQEGQQQAETYHYGKKFLHSILQILSNIPQKPGLFKSGLG